MSAHRPRIDPAFVTPFIQRMRAEGLAANAAARMLLASEQAPERGFGEPMPWHAADLYEEMTRARHFDADDADDAAWQEALRVERGRCWAEHRRRSLDGGRRWRVGGGR